MDSQSQSETLESMRKFERRVRHLKWKWGRLDRPVRVWNIDK
jgi:hypothetical protein